MNSEEINPDDIPQMIEDCQNRSSKLSDTELKFIDDISISITERPLTQRQIVWLSKIWDRIT